MIRIKSQLEYDKFIEAYSKNIPYDDQSYIKSTDTIITILGELSYLLHDIPKQFNCVFLLLSTTSTTYINYIPSSITELRISIPKCNSPYFTYFPHSIEYLKIDVLNNYRIDKLPYNISNLYLGVKFTNNVYNIPNNIIQLVIKSNYTSSFMQNNPRLSYNIKMLHGNLSKYLTELEIDNSIYDTSTFEYIYKYNST